MSKCIAQVKSFDEFVKLQPVSIRIDDQLWGFFVYLDKNNHLVVQPEDWDEFHEEFPDGVSLEHYQNGITYRLESYS